MSINGISYKKQTTALFAIICSLSFFNSFSMGNFIFQKDVVALVEYKKNMMAKQNMPCSGIYNEQKDKNFDCLLEQIKQKTKDKPEIQWGELKTIINDVIYNIPILYKNSYLNFLHKNSNKFEDLQEIYSKKIVLFFKGLEDYLNSQYKNKQLLYNFMGNKQALITRLMNEINEIKKQLPTCTRNSIIEEAKEQDFETTKTDVDITETETPGSGLAMTDNYSFPK